MVKALYRNQATIENSKPETIYIFRSEKFDLPSFFQNLEIKQSLGHHKFKIGQNRSQNCTL